MRIVTAEKILKILGLSKESNNYQLIYKIDDLIKKDVTDGFVIHKAVTRGLLDRPKCENCGKDMEDIYSFNGVLDSWSCPTADIMGKCKSKKKKVK